MGSVRDSIDGVEGPSTLSSFDIASDDELADSFNSRLSQVASSGTAD